MYHKSMKGTEMNEILNGLLGENIEIRASFKKFFKDKKNNRIYKNCLIRFDKLNQNNIDDIVYGEFEEVFWIDESYKKIEIGPATLLKVDEIFRVEYLIGEREQHGGGVEKVMLEDLTLVWDKRVNLSNQWIQIRCNVEEKQRWQKAAEADGCPQLSSWIKQLLNRES